MDLGIGGRRAIVSGASRGMGHAIALRLGQEGARLTIGGRDPARLEAAAQRIREETGAEVTPVAGDITLPATQARMLAACPEPDILVTNADGPAPGDFRDWSREEWIAALDTLMLTPIALIRATIDGMVARRFGRVVSISSRTVKIAQAELGLSNGPRTGLVGFLAGLSRQVVRHNVTINSLLPGPFATDSQVSHVQALSRLSGRPFEEIWKEREAGTAAGRFGRPEEVGAYCAFLCSDLAGFITGQNLLIDGGAYPGTF